MDIRPESELAEPATGPPLTFSAWLAATIRRWRYLLWSILLAVAVGAIAAIAIPPVYKSHASFVAHSSASGRISQALGSGILSGLTAQLGIPSTADVTESPNFYVELIASDEFMRRLARTPMPDVRSSNPADSTALINLMRIRASDPDRRMEIAVKRLRRSVSTRFDTRARTNVVTIETRAQWSDVAAGMANRSVELVDAFNRQLRNKQAREKREFLQQRLDSAATELRFAESRQRVFYEQNRQWRNSPGLTFEEGQLRRQVEVSTDLYLTLQRLFETARLEEFDNAGMVATIDTAVPPRKAQWPRYWVILVASVLIGGLVGIVVAGSSAVMSDWRQRNPAAMNALSSSIAETPLRIGRWRKVKAREGPRVAS